MSVNPARDLGAQSTHAADSWFFSGRLKAENDDVYDYLVHHMKVDVPGGKVQFAMRQFSLTNITKGWHKADQMIVPLSEITASTSAFDFRMPASAMSGDLDKMSVKTATAKGGVDLTMHPEGPVLYYNGGQFPWLDVPVWEYALPKVKTTGTITVDGKTLKVSGTSWLDRQWEDVSPIMMTNNFKWTWMAINLNNHGDVLAVWDIVHEGKENAFATILSPDGAITTVEVTPLSKSASKVWESPDSGRKYPNRWLVSIPSMKTSLEVTTTKPGQEILSVMACGRPQGCKNPDNGLQHNYQSAATVKGTYKGKKVTGYSHLELVGGW
jgi:predicted secreted hydrolase